MNPLANLIQPRKKNNLMRWLNSSKPAISANLAPIQKFVKRTTKGAHSYFANFHADDQTVGTTSTWEDNTSIHSTGSEYSAPRIKQTLVIVSREPPVASIMAAHPKASIRRKSMNIQQRKSQQKNKVLMLLQLEQISGERNVLRQRWIAIRQNLIVEALRRQTQESQRIIMGMIQALEERIWINRHALPENSIRELVAFYLRFDTCLAELHERNEIMDLEAFKQLVIREIQERGDSLNDYRERLKVVHGQLMQKFIVDELIEGGLYDSSELPSRRRQNEILNEWIDIDQDFHDPRNAIAEYPGDGSEWVVCDF